MKITTLATAAAIAAFLMGGVALADTAPAAPATAPAAAPAKPAPVVHSAKSIECSKQADAKQLHGAERKKFRAECLKAK